MLSIAVPLVVMLFSPASAGDDDGLGFHADYYLGFSQGVYYGLMLGDVSYDVAWCVKSELAHEAQNMGTGGEFQGRLEATLASCQTDQQR